MLIRETKKGNKMIEKFCEYLVELIRKQMPEMDDDQAAVVLYGIEIIIGEIPKIFLMFITGFLLGYWWQTLAAFFLILPYKVCSGGFHLKTHIGCILCTNIIYCGNAILSSLIVLPDNIKWLLVAVTAILGILCVTKYAPADTENLPILTKKERHTKKALSYLFLGINLIAVIFVPNTIVSNILLFGTIIQTLSITKLAYKLTKNQSGYELYLREQVANHS